MPYDMLGDVLDELGDMIMPCGMPYEPGCMLFDMLPEPAHMAFDLLPQPGHTPLDMLPERAHTPFDMLPEQAHMLFDVLATRAGAHAIRYATPADPCAILCDPGAPYATPYAT